MPKISVITVNYNNADGLHRTMQSVFGQQLKDLEYIVVDGDSDDGSKQLIAEHRSGITRAVSEPDSGVYNAMNKGIAMATGDYLLFLNSADVLYNSTVLSEIAAELNGNEDIYYGNLIFSNAGREELRDYPASFDFTYFLERSLPHPGSFIKRELFERIFTYSENYSIVSDWEFFICAILKEKVTYRHLDKVISVFELDGMSNDPANKAFIEEEREQVIVKHFPEKYAEYLKWREERSNDRAHKVKSADSPFTKKIKSWLKRLK